MQFVSFLLQPTITTFKEGYHRARDGLESKFNFPRRAILCFLIGHGHVTIKKLLHYNHVHCELNKLHLFNVQNKTDLNFPFIHHVPTN
jgi:hypothetical protein